MILFEPASLQHALRQFMAHYHTERNHQGLENRIPQPMPVNRADWRVSAGTSGKNRPTPVS
jgi:hypothetical protein